MIHDQLRVPFWIDELGILAGEIGFEDPTGLRAATANADSDAFLNRTLKEILQRSSRSRIRGARGSSSASSRTPARIRGRGDVAQDGTDPEPNRVHKRA